MTTSRLPNQLIFRTAGAVLALAGCAPQSPDGGRDTDTDGSWLPDVPRDTDTLRPGEGPREVVLRLPEGEPPELELDLDRGEVEALFGPVADEIVLLDLDMVPLVEGALDRAKAACGTDWKRNVSDPVYDCSLTPLGRTFVGPDGTWRSSPEFSLVRILTTTPANADVEGSSVSLLAGLADFLNLGGGFGQILADSLQISRTTEFLETGPLARSIVDHVAAPHPATLADGTLSVTLADALADGATFAVRFGPTGSHPGMLDPASPTYIDLFTDAFRMVATFRSNLRVVEGLDLGRGKDWIGVVVDTTGPSFDDEVEFDFDDPERFRVEGLAETPSLDMRFRIDEDDRFVPACTSSGSRDCRSNGPGSPIDSQTIWARPTTTIEYVIASAGASRYAGLRTRLCYLGCLVEVGIGQDADPSGFARFGGLAALLAPPPQYVWELLNEIAQIRLHDPGVGTLAEGRADVAFDLEDIPIGLTGPQIAEVVGPVLQEQSSLVSEFLLGDFRKNNGTVDVYWQRTEDGRPTLFHVAPEDLADPRQYGWETPGFFGDAALTTPIHSTTIPGVADTRHLKWQPPQGAGTAWVRDDDRRIWRLDTWLADSSDPRAPLVVEITEETP